VPKTKLATPLESGSGGGASASAAEPAEDKRISEVKSKIDLISIKAHQSLPELDTMDNLRIEKLLRLLGPGLKPKELKSLIEILFSKDISPTFELLESLDLEKTMIVITSAIGFYGASLAKDHPKLADFYKSNLTIAVSNYLLKNFDKIFDCGIESGKMSHLLEKIEILNKINENIVKAAGKALSSAGVTITRIDPDMDSFMMAVKNHETEKAKLLLGTVGYKNAIGNSIKMLGADSDLKEPLKDFISLVLLPEVEHGIADHADGSEERAKCDTYLNYLKTAIKVINGISPTQVLKLADVASKGRS
jgi:hypothetical protein